LVVQPQFRGSSGFSKKLLEAGYGQWGKKMQDDLTDTLALLVKEQLTDPDRICIVGASYGGYAALAGAAFTPDLYQCALSIAGVSHLPAMLKADKSRYGRDHEVLQYFERSILDGKYDSDALKEISPYFSADRVTIPVLLMHGEDDTIVEYNQSKLMHRALKKAGRDVELVKLKNEDHYLREGSTRLQALQTIVGFVDKHIGDR
ncbi:MAG: prolyl oligopeptidase family serine peptidase, partial [Pseudomonadota bacterium]